MIEITIPLRLQVGNAKRTTLSLSRNVWDNLHWTKRTKVKTIIQALVASQATMQKPVHGIYGYSCWLYLGSTGQDLDNFADVAMKIITDSLVSSGHLDGDSCKLLQWGSRLFMGVDAKNPRIIVRYSEIEK